MLLKIVPPNLFHRRNGLVNILIGVAFVYGEAEAGGLQGVDVGAGVGIVGGVLPECGYIISEGVVFTGLDNLGAQDVFDGGHAGVDGDAFGAEDVDHLVAGGVGASVTYGKGPPGGLGVGGDFGEVEVGEVGKVVVVAAYDLVAAGDGVF